MFNLSAIQRPWVVHYKPSTGSTMDDAAALGEAGAGHLTAVLADVQHAGRGRQGKVWQTFPGVSVAITYIIRHGQGPHLPLVASLAVRRALAVHGFAVAIKWPNDLLLGGQKVAGLLAEQRAASYLLGIGLNVGVPEVVPAGFPGTFLAAHGTAPAREELVNTLCACLQDCLGVYEEHQWPALAEEYTAHCATLGQPVRWARADGNEIVGMATGLDADGALELTDAAGTRHRIVSGEVVAQGAAPRG